MKIEYKTKTKPWKHQIRAFEFMQDKKRVALFPTMGAGKSKMFLDWLYHYWEKKEAELCIIFAPNGVHQQWLFEQIPNHYYGESISLLWRSSKAKQQVFQDAFKQFLNFKYAEKGMKFFIVNTEILGRKSIFSQYLAEILDKNIKIALVMDEITSIKNMSSNTTKKALTLAQHKNISLCCGLTGTEVTESPVNLYPMLEFVKPKFLEMSFESFSSRYAIKVSDSNPVNNRMYQRELKQNEKNKILWYFKKIKNNVEVVESHTGRNTGELWDVFKVARILFAKISDINYLYNLWEKEGCPDSWEVPKYKYLDQLIKKIAPICFSVGPEALDIPDVFIEDIGLEMNPKVEKLYKELERKLIATYETTEKTASITVTHKIALVTRLQQVSGGFMPNNDGPPLRMDNNIKLAFLLNDLQSIPLNDKVIIWARFVPEIAMLESELLKIFPEQVRTYYGKDTSEQKENNKNIFLELGSKVRFLIVNPQSGSMGLNLQSANWNYLYSVDFSLLKYEQLIKRTVRPHQKKKVHFKRLVYLKSVDVDIYKALTAKKEIHDFFREAKELKHFD